jgi:hypothetical protein
LTYSSEQGLKKMLPISALATFCSNEAKANKKPLSFYSALKCGAIENTKVQAIQDMKMN